MNRFVLFLVFFFICGSAVALRTIRPPTLSYPVTEDQISQLNKFLEDVWNVQYGRFELDVVTTSKTNAKNGEHWITTGAQSCFQWKAAGAVYESCGTAGSSSSGSNDSGWTDDGTIVRLTTSTDNVGIGTTAAIKKLSVDGDVNWTQRLYYNGLPLTYWDAAGARDYTFLGYQAGFNNDESQSYSDIFIGHQSGYSNTSGYNNIFQGYQAGYSTTSGDSNVYMGPFAGYSGTTAYSNIVIGRQAMDSNVLGSQNIVIGDDAVGISTTGTGNVVIGASTGFQANMGNNNIFLGYSSAGSGGVSRSTCIGFECFVTDSNNIILGGTTANGRANVGIGTAHANQTLVVDNFNIAKDLFNVLDNHSSVFIIKDGGNVGLGTINPQRTLDVNGAVKVTGLVTGVNVFMSGTTPGTQAGTQLCIGSDNQLCKCNFCK